MNCNELVIFKMVAVRHLGIVVCLHETTREEYLVWYGMVWYGKCRFI